MVENKLAKNKIINIIGAVISNILVPGLGQVSCGKIKRGIFIFIASLLLIPICLIIITRPFPPFNIVISAFLYVGFIIFIIVDAIRIAKNPENSLKVKPIIGYLILIAIWQVHSNIVYPFISGIIKRDFFQAYKIPSESMIPTLLVGDHLLVDKHIYKTHEPNRGDIVILPSPDKPEKDFVRRIVALGGETLEIKAKRIYINGKLLQEDYAYHTDPYIFPAEQNRRDYLSPTTVPMDSFFVMGDNRDVAYDSRFWGFVKKTSIKAKIINLYWSWDKNARTIRWDRIGKSVL